jgi:hypothetical protein
MRLCRLFVAAALVIVATSVAKADPVDPKVLIGGGGSCAVETLTSLTQAFTEQTGCPIDFINDIVVDDEGFNLNKIVVNIASSFAGPLGCDFDTTEGVLPSPFNSAVVSSPTSCTFSNVFLESLTETFDTITGVPFGKEFSLNFDPNFGSTVSVVLAQDIVSSPEPATLFLLASGLGGLCALRKRRQAQ